MSHISLSSPNPIEVKFLNDPTKKDEYMEHISTKLSLPRDPVVVDVGANIGAFSCRIAHYLNGEGLNEKGNKVVNEKNSNGNGRVFAIEPFAELFDHLLKNTAPFSTVQCRKLAIGTERGEIQGTYLPNYTLLSGFHVSDEDRSMLENLAGRSLDREFAPQYETVQCITLSDFLEQENLTGKIDILKIDVEKAELDVLKSLGDRLADVNCVVAEVHEENLQDFVAKLESRYGQGKCWVSEKDLPKFTLGGTPDTWADQLNTYIVFAH